MMRKNLICSDLGGGLSFNWKSETWKVISAGRDNNPLFHLRTASNIKTLLSFTDLKVIQAFISSLSCSDSHSFFLRCVRLVSNPMVGRNVDNGQQWQWLRLGIKNTWLGFEKMFCFGFTGSTQTGQVIVLTFHSKYRFLTADCPDVSSETLSLVTTSLEQLKISSGFTLVKHKCWNIIVILLKIVA